MSLLLRQLNDAIIEKLVVNCHCEPAPGEGEVINVGEEFEVKISVENSSQQYPQITFLNVVLEVRPVLPFSRFKDNALKKRESLGTIRWDTKKEFVFEMVAMALMPYDWEEPVVKTSIAADVLLRCKDLKREHTAQIRKEGP